MAGLWEALQAYVFTEDLEVPTTSKDVSHVPVQGLHPFKATFEDATCKRVRVLSTNTGRNIANRQILPADCDVARETDTRLNESNGMTSEGWRP